jgi:hypothetical protein
MDNLFAIVGSASFGIFVGFVFRYFLERFETYDLKKLTTVIVVPLGPTLLVFVTDLGPHSRPSYTLGLVLGLVLYQGFYTPFHLPFRRRRAGLMTRIDVHDVITIADASGERATWVRTQKMSFTRDCKDVLISKTGGAGLINPVTITSPGRTVDLDTRRGYIYARFASDIHKGETAEVTRRNLRRSRGIRLQGWITG